MSYTNELAAHAAANGFGTLDTDLFRGRLRPEPNQQIALLVGDGQAAQHAGDSFMIVDRPSMQAFVRGEPGDVAGAETLARSFHNFFDTITGQVIGTHRYQLIRANGEPIYLGPDEQLNRPVYSINFTIRVNR